MQLTALPSYPTDIKVDVKATDKVGITKQDTVGFTVNTSPLFGSYAEETLVVAITIITAWGSVYIQ